MHLLAEKGGHKRSFVNVCRAYHLSVTKSITVFEGEGERTIGCRCKAHFVVNLTEYFGAFVWHLCYQEMIALSHS